MAGFFLKINYHGEAPREVMKSAAELNNHAIELVEKRDFEGALELQNQAVKLVPDCAHFHMQRAQILSELGRFAEALCDAGKAIALDPEEPFFYLGRALIWHRLGGFDKNARADFDKAVARGSKIALFFEERAHFRIGQKDPMGAIVDFATAYKLSRDSRYLD